MLRHARNFQIVEPADDAAFEALFVEFLKHCEDGSLFRVGFGSPILSANSLLPSKQWAKQISDWFVYLLSGKISER